MPDSLGSVFGVLISSFKAVSHILVLLMHNGLLIAIAVALLYGIFKLGRSAVRQLRRAPGEQPEESHSAPKDTPENGYE